MPFGLCNAPASFQRAINSALFPYLNQFCTAYLDDVLVYSTTQEEHVTHVKAVLSQLKSQGFYVDPKKSEFHTTRVKFLRIIITDKGIEIDPAKVSAIRD
jgi:beta-lactamase superfamily II metal-dependent hydrolase